MSKLKHENLRSLCGLHEEGAVDRPSYRSARRALIDAVVAGELAAPVIKDIDGQALDEPTVPCPEPRPSNIEPRQPSSVGEATAASERATDYRSWLIASGALSLLTLALLAWWAISPTPAPVASNPTPDMTLMSLMPQGSPLTQTLGQFLRDKDWSSAKIQSLKDAWYRASAADRTDLKSNLDFREFETAAFARLTESKAVASATDDPEILQRQRELVDLARVFGLAPERWQAEELRLIAEEDELKAALASESAATVEAPPSGTTATLPPPPETLPAPTLDEPPPPPPVVAAEVEPAPLSEPEQEPSVSTKPLPEANVASSPDADPEPPSTPALPESAAASAVLPPEEQPSVRAKSDDAVAAATPAEAPATPAPTAAKPALKRSPGSTPEVAAKPPAAPQSAAKRTGTSCRAELANSRKPFCRDKLPGGGNGPTLAVLPQGEFAMGSARPGEGPVRKVRIQRPFAMAVEETSVREYLAYCKAIGRACGIQPWPSEDFPVVRVTWQDAVAYTEWLSAATGARYRLPSEAEWEYAARAGTTSSYPFGEELLPVHAQFVYQTPPEAPLPRNDKRVNRNAFRLLHTVGNVREWVADVWEDDYAGASNDSGPRQGTSPLRVVRGGSYRDQAEALHSSARMALPAGSADDQTGFRVVLDLP